MRSEAQRDLPLRRELPFLLGTKRQGDRETPQATLVVKTVLDRAVYINCEERPGVREGAVIWSNWARGNGREPLWQVADGGIYDAIAAIVYHIPSSYAGERKKIALAQGWLAWMLQTSWSFTKAASEEEIEAYQAEVDKVLGVLEHVRDAHKVRARLQTVRARSGTDSRGRVNWASRWPIIWNADHELDKRVRLGRVIEGKLDPRKVALIMLLDDVWRLKKHILRSVESELQTLRSGRTLTAREVARMSDRLEDCAKKLSSVSIAPWGRRAFMHSADDLRSMIEQLRQGNRAGATVIGLRVARSLGPVQDTRRMLEESRTVVSMLQKAGDVPDPADVHRLVRVILEAEGALSVPGIDDGFKRPLAEPARALLEAARLAATADGIYRGEEVYCALEEACNMI